MAGIYIKIPLYFFAMSLDTALRSLKAAADPTRLRLLALLAGGEVTVGELTEILGQSQPRVSRHLRLLDEAGLVSRFRDGQWIYYGLSSSTPVVNRIRQIIEMAGDDDPVFVQDRDALSRIKRNRERDAYNTKRFQPWPGATGAGPRPAESEMLEALEESSGERRFGDVLNVGCGNGTLLCLLGELARAVIGVDGSKSARLLARSRIHRYGLVNCTVRRAELPTLPFDDAAFDLVVLTEVLVPPGDLLSGLREAIRVLRQDGRLIILDRIQPAVRRLPRQPDTGSLFENCLIAQLSELGYKVSNRIWFPGRVMEYALFSAVPETTQLRTGTND